MTSATCRGTTLLLPSNAAKADDMIHLSNCLLAAAHLKDATPAVKEIVPEVVELLQIHGGQMNPKNLTNCFWALGQLAAVAPPSALKEVYRSNSDEKKMISHNSSDLLCAVVHLRDVAPGATKIVPAVVAQIQEIDVSYMSVNHMLNSLWALAHFKDMGPNATRLVPALVYKILGHWYRYQRNTSEPSIFSTFVENEMTPHVVCKCLLSAACLKDTAPEAAHLVDVLRELFRHVFVSMNSEELSNSLWAVEHLRGAYLEEVPSLVKHIEANIDNMSLQEISTCLWAAARLTDAAPDVLKIIPALAAKIPQTMDRSGPSQ